MNLPPLPEPAAHNCEWRGDNDSCGWAQWHDAIDPMPAMWEGTPPDEVTPVFTADQMHAYATAALAQAGAAPVAWLVDVAEHQNQYAVVDADDAQLLDDCTNHGATVTPLYVAPAAIRGAA